MNDRKLRSIMILHNDTIDELAEYLGITRQTLHNKMSGRTDFTRNEMIMIKQRYKLNDDEFVETFDAKG